MGGLRRNGILGVWVEGLIASSRFFLRFVSFFYSWKFGVGWFCCFFFEDFLLVLGKVNLSLFSYENLGVFYVVFWFYWSVLGVRRGKRVFVFFLFGF